MSPPPPSRSNSPFQNTFTVPIENVKDPLIIKNSEKMSFIPETDMPKMSNMSNLPNISSVPTQQNMLQSILKESSHPTALLFHFGFRSVALGIYLLSGIFGGSFMFSVVMIVILLAIDFWTVKNVTGRLLIGKRWWSGTGLEGETVFSFESRPLTYKPNPIDSRLFWASLYGFVIIWGLLGVVALLSFNFSWLIIVGYALLLNITNLMGYIKCDRESQDQMISGWKNSIVGGIITNRLSSMLS